MNAEDGVGNLFLKESEKSELVSEKPVISFIVKT